MPWFKASIWVGKQKSKCCGRVQYVRDTQQDVIHVRQITGRIAPGGNRFSKIIAVKVSGQIMSVWNTQTLDKIQANVQF